MSRWLGRTRFDRLLTRKRFGPSVCICALANGQDLPPSLNSYSEQTRCCVYRIKATGCKRTYCYRELSDGWHGIYTSHLLKSPVVCVPYHNSGVRISQHVEQQGVERPLLS